MALIFHSLKVEYSVEFSFLIGGKLAARFTSPNNNTFVVGKGVLTIEVVPLEEMRKKKNSRLMYLTQLLVMIASRFQIHYQPSSFAYLGS